MVARDRTADQTAHRARVRAVVAPVVEAAGYEVDGLTVSRAGRRHLVRVVVDGDADLGLDAIAEVSRSISVALDEAERSGGEVIAGEYVLEVSSPGVDRPLTRPRHWRRNVGRLVAVTADGHRLTGRITAVDDERVMLEVDGRRHEFSYPVLGPGRIQIEFGRLDEIAQDDLAGFEEEEDEE